ncbi:MAG: hypothetical protein K0S30_1858, partial [Clostridia bacterium]|nr:hypothetical protein [Clostridia bacterium]
GKELETLDQVFELYNPKLLQQKQLMEEYLEYLVLTLNNVFLIFDPECVIIGGEMSEYQTQIEPIIKQIMIDNPCSMLKINRKIEFSTLGYKASKYGASLMAFEEVIALI